jgi:chromodomain-helicase-DNA-binding protein 7
MQKERLKLETDIKFERPEDILKTDKNEIIVKLEKGEGTLKIEKIGVKKEMKVPETVGQIKSETDMPLKQEKNEVELTLVKTGIKSECEAVEAEDENESTVTTVKKTSSLKEMETEEEKAESGADTTQEIGTEDIGDESTELKEIAKESSIENIDNDNIVEVHCESLEREEFLQEDQKVDEEESQNERNPETDSNSKEIFEKLVENTEDKMEVYPNKEPDETIETEKSMDEDKCDNSEVMKDEVEKTNEKDGLEEDSKETGHEESVAMEMSETRESAEASSLEDKNRMRSCESDVVSENSLKGEESLDAVPHSTKQQTNCNTNPQAAELKAMFPDLEVIQPLSRLAEVEPYVLGGKQPSHSSGEILDYSEPTVAQLLAQSYQNPIKWPKVRSVTVF